MVLGRFGHAQQEVEGQSQHSRAGLSAGNSARIFGLLTCDLSSPAAVERSEPFHHEWVRAAYILGPPRRCWRCAACLAALLAALRECRHGEGRRERRLSRGNYAIPPAIGTGLGITERRMCDYFSFRAETVRVASGGLDSRGQSCIALVIPVSRGKWQFLRRPALFRHHLRAWLDADLVFARCGPSCVFVVARTYHPAQSCRSRPTRSAWG